MLLSLKHVKVISSLRNLPWPDHKLSLGFNGMIMGLFCSLLVAYVNGLAAQDLGSAGNRPATPGISLTISAVHDEVKMGAPVEIKLNLKNESGKDYVFTRSGSWECTYGIEVRDENGKIPPETKLGIMFNGHVAQEDWDKAGLTVDEMLHACTSGISFVDLKAGQSVTSSLDVTGKYRLMSPGKYTVQVVLDQVLDHKIFGKSNTTSVTITQ